MKSSFELGSESGWDLLEDESQAHPEFTEAELIEFVRGVLDAATRLLDDLTCGFDDLLMDDLADLGVLPV